ncbi:dienelactone hydrolase family protein [Arthrobacter sp. NPDC090010]|uniref:dienelactone hydrolase family protein n=1 Tax=Arthrobacter sp. NPDC090010 TaxID=3363942 RepID=UPI00380ADA70
MAEIALFHHALGLTEGLQEFAERLRAAGHTVHAPDMFDGRVFGSIEEGVEYADGLGWRHFLAATSDFVATLPEGLVYAGFSLGGTSAQNLAHSRTGARGALIYYGAASPSWFSRPWPDGVPAQIHVAEQDPWAELAESKEAADAYGAELFVYPEVGHLFAESGWKEYGDAAAQLLLERTLAFLESVDRAA